MSIKNDLTVCRVCMIAGKWISLFSDSEAVKQFQFCTQLKISENDGLPKGLCKKCVGELKVAYEFRTQAQVADKYLKQAESYDYLEKKIDRIALQQHNESEIFIKTLLDDPIYIEEEPLNIKVEEFEGVTMEPNLEALSYGNEQNFDFKSNIDILMGNVYNGGQIYLDNNSKIKKKRRKNSKPYQCPTCKKKFSRNSLLQVHLRTHSGVKPYLCKICDIRFTTNYSLKQHTATAKHNERVSAFICKWENKECNTNQKKPCIDSQLCKICNTELSSKLNPGKQCDLCTKQQELKAKERRECLRSLKRARETPEETVMRREREAENQRRCRAKRANKEVPHIELRDASDLLRTFL